MAILYNKFSSRLILTLIIVWGAFSFWISTNWQTLLFVILLLSIFALLLVFLNKGAIFILIFTSFTTSYSLYNFLFNFNLPIWLVMLAILVIFCYLFYLTEQKIGILGDKRMIYLVLFSLIVLEIFLTLNYFIISPLSKSLIISIISYLFVGFCYSVLAKHDSPGFKTYLFIAVSLIVLVFVSAIWGSNI